ncbi:MAG: beta-galactosidase, partial [Candidatus Amesbacteria bacterium GW2011_GWB1_48_13]
MLPADTAGKAISLNFDRISAAAEVYVNDKFAGFHIGSTDPFEFPIHDLTVSGQTNKLAIRIIDMAEYQNKMLPASYQDRTHGGIYGDAKLTVSDKNKINLVKAYTPDNASVSLSAVVTNYSTASSSMTLKAEVVSSTGMVVGSGTSAAFTLGAGGKTTKSWNISSVPGVLKWSPENPNLYTIRTTLIRSGISVDQTVMNFGFRSFGISSDTQKFTLNGSKYFLKGASIVAHREVRNDPVFIKNFVAKVKESGANAIRFHLGPPSHYWLDETDRQGVLAVIEFALDGFHNLPFGETWFSDLTKAEYARYIDTHYSRPSVVIWSLGNENILGDPGNNTKRDFFNRVASGLKAETDARHYYLNDAGCMSFSQTPTSTFTGSLADICGSSDITDSHWYHGWGRMSPDNAFIIGPSNQYSTDMTVLSDALDQLFAVPVSKPHLFTEYGGAYTDDQGNFWPLSDLVNRPSGDSAQSIYFIGSNPVPRPDKALAYQQTQAKNSTQTLYARKDSTRLAGIFYHGFDFLIYNSTNLNAANLKQWYLDTYLLPCKTNLPCITADGSSGSQKYSTHAALEGKPGFYALQQIFKGITPSPTPTPAISCSVVYNPSSGTAPLATTATCSVSGGSGITDYRWDSYSDGTYEQSSLDQSATSHAFSIGGYSAGTHTGKCEVTRNGILK